MSVFEEDTMSYSCICATGDITISNKDKSRKNAVKVILMIHKSAIKMDKFDNSENEKSVCPNDRQLALRAK